MRLHYVEGRRGARRLPSCSSTGFLKFRQTPCFEQIEPLVAAGFRVVAPDMRGYNLSSKPEGVAAYDTGRLADDIRNSSTSAAPRPRCWAVMTGAGPSPGPPR